MAGSLHGSALRANDDETSTPWKFSLEGAEGSSGPCPWFKFPSTPRLMPPAAEAAGRRWWRHRSRPHLNWRIGHAGGPSLPRTSCGFSPRPIAPLRPAASAPSCAARASTCLLYTSDAADDLLCVDLG